jgi:hypothetical protein
VVQSYIASQTACMRRHVGPLVASRRAYSGLDNLLSSDATLWGYIDDFKYLACLCAFCVIAVMFLKRTAGNEETVG